jgi:ribonuclease HII
MKKYKTSPNLREEKKLWQKYKNIAGVDEVGRGCLAGPVVACAVVLPKSFIIPTELNDSKKLTQKIREELFENFTNDENIDFALGWVDESEIDEINILQATFLAMKKAVNNLKAKADFLLIDGNRFVQDFRPHKCIIKGDQKSVSIATASVIAKVSRDRFMSCEMEEKYSGYDFALHKGYATKKHFEAIDRLGISPIHRHSFLRKYKARQLELFT